MNFVRPKSAKEEEEDIYLTQTARLPENPDVNADC